MYKDIQTAISFTNLSDVRRDRLSALLSGAERAWRVYDAQGGVYHGHAYSASYQASDLQKASARLLRLGRR